MSFKEANKGEISIILPFMFQIVSGSYENQSRNRKLSLRTRKHRLDDVVMSERCPGHVFIEANDGETSLYLPRMLKNCGCIVKKAEAGIVNFLLIYELK